MPRDFQVSDNACAPPILGTDSTSADCRAQPLPYPIDRQTMMSPMNKTTLLAAILALFLPLQAQSQTKTASTTSYGYCSFLAEKSVKDGRGAMVFSSMFEIKHRPDAFGHTDLRNKFVKAATTRFPDWKISGTNGGCPVHFASANEAQRELDEGVKNQQRYGEVRRFDWRP